MTEKPTHRIHMISFERLGSNSYATLHPGKERMVAWQWQLLRELVEQNETQPVIDNAEDLA